jgi:hypothetical protein
MAAYQTQYLEKGKVSRGLRKPGEVFALKFKGVGYLFGRVIRNDCACEPLDAPRPWKRTPGYYLVYIYTAVSKSMRKIPELRRDDLLIPPEIIVGAGWTRGYFVPVRQAELKESDVRPIHCFWHDDIMDSKRPKLYTDEYGNPLPRRTKPCTFGGVGDFVTIEGQIAEALGLPYQDPWEVDAAPGADSGSVVVVIPTAEREPELHMWDLEDRLIEAVEEASAGRWEGHGFDARTKQWDIRFDTRHPSRTERILLHVLRTMKLPRGSHLVKVSRRGKRQRVEI